ncbi:MAG: SDR family NAD(P)-dependent oxidoreductase [Bacteroidales bacterium]|nr:SDR family NAD(P)-dependent oxidoreductase [Bacteroidales bacterium]
MNNRYALVTGASSGIGYQYARVMAGYGYNLIIVSNEEAIFEKAGCLTEEYSVHVIALLRDLGQENAAKELFDYCQKEHLLVEVLINNAGVYHSRDFIEDTEGFNKLILALHMTTPAMLSYYFGQEMAKRKKGYILNMCSVTSHIAVQKLATYSATKAFLTNFTRSLHVELRYQGVDVTAVSPGAVATTLYNLNEKATKFGLAMGYIVTPEKLAKKGVKAMFKRRAKASIPSLYNGILIFLASLIPTGLLRLIRKWGWF